MVQYVWFLMSDEPSALCLSERLPLGPSEKRLRREPGVSLPAGARQQKTSRGEWRSRVQMACHPRQTPPALTRPHFVAQRVEEELYSSSSQLKKQFEGGAEPFLYDTHSNLQRTTLPRQQHHHLMREPSTPTGQALWLFGFRQRGFGCTKVGCKALFELQLH